MSRTILALSIGVALSGSAVVCAPALSQAKPNLSHATPAFDPVPADKPDFNGKWIMAKPIRALKTSDGSPPPLNAAGKAQYAKTRAALKADPKTDPLSDCLMHGVPRLLYAPYPFLILQYGKHVDFVHEVNHTVRIVYFNQPPPDDPDPHWLGWPTAHWDGRTLVIDTIGFNDLTWLDYSGLPHGEQLKVQERYQLHGDRVQAQVIITDPQFYTAPWRTDFTLVRRPGYDLKESICTRDHKM